MNNEIIYTDSLGLEWSREDLEKAGGKEKLEENYKLSSIKNNGKKQNLSAKKLELVKSLINK